MKAVRGLGDWLCVGYLLHMKRFLSASFAFFVLGVSRAFAGDPFTVGGIKVDATAATAIEAQVQAMGEGQLVAANALFNRLTLEQERLANPLPVLTQENVARMIRALEPSQERRSANRYLGEITVAFNPSQVQQFLRENNLTLVSSQARERLVVVRDSGLRGELGLQSAFDDPRFAYALTPLRVASAEDVAFLSLSPSDDELKALAQKYNLNQVLIVNSNGNLTDVSLDTGNRQSYFVSPGIDSALFADQVVQRLEADWKQVSAVVATEVVTTSVSVLYTSHRDWIALQEAINTSAQIRDARLDALSKDGALMTISYGGDVARLSNELRFKGVLVEQDPNLGLVLRRS
jgi:hypothetical protein